MFKYVLCVFNYVQWAWNFLLHYSFSSHVLVPNIPEIYEVSDITYCNYGQNCTETYECAVCLCKIEEGDQIRVLKCSHVFHRVCLDRWLVYNHAKCPLCRRSLLSSFGSAIGELGIEVITFKFCSFSSNDDRDNWWLR